MKKTQRQKVEDILKVEGKVSNFHALETRLTIRLGAIIHNLRQDGWDIETEMHGSECVYVLKGQPTRTVMRPVFLENGMVKLVPKQESI